MRIAYLRRKPYSPIGLLSIIWACFLLVSPTHAQLIKFKHLTTENGLSQSNVMAIAKDHKGFMWFATKEGLNKYDGYSFIVYKHDPSDAKSLRQNELYDLPIDKAGVIASTYPS